MRQKLVKTLSAIRLALTNWYDDQVSQRLYVNWRMNVSPRDDIPVFKILCIIVAANGRDISCRRIMRRIGESKHQVDIKLVGAQGQSHQKPENAIAMASLALKFDYVLVIDASADTDANFLDRSVEVVSRLGIDVAHPALRKRFGGGNEVLLRKVETITRKVESSEGALAFIARADKLKNLELVGDNASVQSFENKTIGWSASETTVIDVAPV